MASIDDILKSGDPVEWIVKVSGSRPNKVLDFSASGSVVDFGDIQDKGTASFTVDVLARVDFNAVVNKVLMAKKTNSTASNAGWQLLIDTANLLTVHVSDGVNQVSTSVNVSDYVNDGYEHRYTMVVDRSAQVVKLYVDQDLVVTSGSISAVGSVNNSVSLRVGNNGGGTATMDGSLRDFRIWNIALTQQQVIDWMNLDGGATTGTTFFAAMTEGSGMTVTAISANDLFPILGTVTSATWVNNPISYYFSTHDGRDDGNGPDPHIPPYLHLEYGDLGPLAESLAADPVFAPAAAITPGRLTLCQRVIRRDLDGDIDDQLSKMQNSYFAGGAVEVFIGLQSDAFNDFVQFGTYACAQEFKVGYTDDGIVAEVELASALSSALAQNVELEKYVGIPNCLRFLTTTGAVSVTRNAAAHDLERYTIMARFRINSTTLGGNFNLLRKSLGLTTNLNYRLVITSGEEVLFDNTAGGAPDVSISTSNAGLADNAWHAVIASYDYAGGAAGAYLAVDEVVVAYDTPVGTAPNLAATNLEIGVRAAGSEDIDMSELALFNRYISPDEAIAMQSRRLSGDEPGLVGLWRFDDNAGATVNDYSPTNADGSILGVLNTDYSWQPTDFGEPEQAGQPWPLALGEVFNAPAHPIDLDRERYRVSHGDLAGVGVDTDLTVKTQGTTVAVTDEGTGIVATASAEDMPVTFDTTDNLSSVSSNRLTNVIEQLVTDHSTSSTNFESDMAMMAPFMAGYFTDKEGTLASALDFLVGGSGMFYGENVDGSLYLDALVPPIGYGVIADANNSFNPAIIDGPALEFTGSNGLTFSGATASPTSSISIGCWFKYLNPIYGAGSWGAVPNAGTVELVSVGNVSLYFQALGANSGGTLFFKIGATTTALGAPGLIKQGVWQFLGVSWRDDTNALILTLGDEFGNWRTAVQTSNAGTASSGTTYTTGYVGSGGVDGLRAHFSIRDLVVSDFSWLGGLSSWTAFAAHDAANNYHFWAPLSEGEGAPSDLTSGVTATGYTTVVGYPDKRWAPQFTINLDEIPSLKFADHDMLRELISYDEIVVKYKRNYRVMTEAEIDTGLDRNLRMSLAQEWQEARVGRPNRTQSSRHRRVEVQSPVSRAIDAFAVGQLIQQRAGEGFLMGVLNIPSDGGINVARRAMGVRLLDEIGLTGSVPASINTPRSFRVIGRAPRPLQMTNTLTLWGK